MPALSGSQKAYRQARSGIARAGASRCGAFTPNQVITIGGINCSAKIEKGSVGITLNSNDVPDTARFTLNPNPGFTPVDDQVVVIGLGTGANAIFTGVITKVTHRRRPALQTPFFDIECTDDTRLLDAHLVTADWVNVDAGALVKDLITRFAPTFSTVNVQTGIQTIGIVSANFEKVSSVIRRVATLINGGCYWAHKDIHLYGPAGEVSFRAPTLPRPITDTLPTLIGEPTTSAPQHQVDGSQKRTRVSVTGPRTRSLVGTPSGATTAIVATTASIDYLVVAGGGAGGAGTSGGGGGGGGGVLAGTFVMPVSTAATITIGAGGATVGANGGNSAFGGFVALGGGGGGGSVAPGSSVGSNGGSGGGGNSRSGSAPFAPNPGGTGVAGQGTTGGSGENAGSASGGGGGGAGAGGSNATAATGGAGGSGLSSSLSGAPAYYGGGGGGNGNVASGAGGLGGGGNGGAGGSPSTAGAANTGGGGGGSSDNSNARQAGGSGLVLLRYLTGTVTATGGAITSAGGYTVHTFTAGGTFTLSAITSVTPIPLVTNLPVADATVLFPTGGNLVIGNLNTTYTATLGPGTSGGTNQKGSTLSADCAAGATSLPVTDVSQFTDAHGWVAVGEQVVLWGSKSGSALTGVPATGFGALNAAVKAGTAVSWLGSIDGLGPGGAGLIFSPPLVAGTAIVQLVVVDDAAAIAALQAARGGGDGIVEYRIDDPSLTVPMQAQVAYAALAAYGRGTILANWTTFDLNAVAGVKQVFTRTAPEPLAVSLLITRVDISFPAPSHLPIRKCQGSSARLPSLIDVFTVNKT